MHIASENVLIQLFYTFISFCIPDSNKLPSGCKLVMEIVTKLAKFALVVQRNIPIISFLRKRKQKNVTLCHVLKNSGGKWIFGDQILGWSVVKYSPSDRKALLTPPPLSYPYSLLQPALYSSLDKIVQYFRKKTRNRRTLCVKQMELLCFSCIIL